MERSQLRVVDKKLSDYYAACLLHCHSVRVQPCGEEVHRALRTCAVSEIPFWQVKRYVESVVNLVSMRTVLIMLGFIKFECDSFRFFTREPSKITLKSGFIAIGTHKSIVDYLYYSYLLNPVFVRIIVYKKEEGEEVYYAPLSFVESLRCALNYRGFDPIIVHNEKEFKHVKYRKMAMKTLISECFQQTNGPVFILLPGVLPNEHLSLNKGVSYDIFKNQVQFERSLVGFCVKLDHRAGIEQSTYRDQLFLLLDLLSSFRINSIAIHAIEFRKFKNRYDKATYSSFIDKYYTEHNLQLRDIDYEQYVMEMDGLDQKKKERKNQ